LESGSYYKRKRRISEKKVADFFTGFFKKGIGSFGFHTP